MGLGCPSLLECKLNRRPRNPWMLWLLGKMWPTCSPHWWWGFAGSCSTRADVTQAEAMRRRPSLVPNPTRLFEAPIGPLEYQVVVERRELVCDVQ